MAEPPYTAAEVDAAVDALREPDRLTHAQDVVTHAAPSLQRVLAESLAAGGWFDQTHEAEVAKAALGEDAQERLRAVRTLVAEETRIGMLVGVAVGFELAHELRKAPRPEASVADAEQQAPGAEQQAPGAEQQAPGAEQQAADAEQQAPGAERHEAGAEQQEPSPVIEPEEQ